MWNLGRGPKFSPDQDIPDLHGRVILVTGGNTGLGEQTIYELAKHGPQKIFLAARSETKALAAIERLEARLQRHRINSTSASTVQLEYLALDLGSLVSVQTAAENVLQSTTRLDLLILNAGIMAVPNSQTIDGFEVQLGTNHIGHFYLTRLLVPLLLKTAVHSDVRVLTVSSDGYSFAPSLETILDTGKLLEAGPWVCYGASKAANIMFAAELCRRYPEIMSVSLHPGVCKTGLFSTAQEHWLVKGLTAVLGALVFVDVETASLNQVYLATTVPRNQLENGGYYRPIGKVARGIQWNMDAKRAELLWEWTEDEILKRGLTCPV